MSSVLFIFVTVSIAAHIRIPPMLPDSALKMALDGRWDEIRRIIRISLFDPKPRMPLPSSRNPRKGSIKKSDSIQHSSGMHPGITDQNAVHLFPNITVLCCYEEMRPEYLHHGTKCIVFTLLVQRLLQSTECGCTKIHSNLTVYTCPKCWDESCPRYIERSLTPPVKYF